jgi:hypothetical protein
LDDGCRFVDAVNAGILEMLRAREDVGVTLRRQFTQNLRGELNGELAGSTRAARVIGQAYLTRWCHSARQRNRFVWE